MADRIQLRRDVAADWTSNDPTLADGEPGWVSDTDELVVGDGSTAFSSLTRFITSATFDVQTDSDVTNAALTDTANTTYLTLNFADPGQAVSVMVHGWAIVQKSGGSGTAVARLDVNIDGNRPGEEAVVENPTTSENFSIASSHGRTWTPSGAFTVTLELWADTTANPDVQHLTSGVTAIMVPG